MVEVNVWNVGWKRNSTHRHGPGDIPAIIRGRTLFGRTVERLDVGPQALDRGLGCLLQLAREVLLVVSPFRHSDQLGVVLDDLGQRLVGAHWPNRAQHFRLVGGVGH